MQIPHQLGKNPAKNLAGGDFACSQAGPAVSGSSDLQRHQRQGFTERFGTGCHKRRVARERCSSLVRSPQVARGTAAASGHLRRRCSAVCTSCVPSGD